MKKILLCLSIVLLSGMAFAMSDHIIPIKVNYKITIEIETPDGLKMGSAVRQLRVSKNTTKFLNPDLNSFSYNVIGEAVVVDINEKGLILELPDSKEVFTAFPHATNVDVIEHYSSLKIGAIANIKFANNPLIIFTNRNDPKSIRTLNNENSKKYFDNNFVIKNISIEIVEEEVTSGQVRKHLNWYDTQRMGLSFKEMKELKDENEPFDHARGMTKDSLIRGE